MVLSIGKVEISRGICTVPICQSFIKLSQDLIKFAGSFSSHASFSDHNSCRNNFKGKITGLM
ncbi:unnamed protein product [Meloidogyne enterolobii]|uniref:Uncharacterized protein n=1 Tax=Meloidogyne enterolobii TaxID=390850 RepID=A0ACB1AWU2_MELEN